MTPPCDGQGRAAKRPTWGTLIGILALALTAAPMLPAAAEVPTENPPEAITETIAAGAERSAVPGDAAGKDEPVEDAGSVAVAETDGAVPALSVVGAPQVGSTRDLFLDVFINSAPTGLVAAFMETDGVLLAEAAELSEIGILPADIAKTDDGRIRIDRLPDVTFRYDETTQTIDFTASDAARAARIIDTEGSKSVLNSAREPAPVLQSGYGALMNYSLFAATPAEAMDEFLTFDGVSGSFEGRMFSPAGVVSQTFVATTGASGLSEATRLDSQWAYSDPSTMLTYRAGDLITGGLDWTRPTRLAGLQLQRNFQLRSDLVTLPIPEISGSAAVPSTIDVYLNGAQRFSKQVAAGPFELVNLPVVTGAGTARVVVRDSSGQEKVSESSFFASSQLLAPGLLDFSAELGFGRQAFGTLSNAYDDRPMGSATARYGLTPWLTAEAHAEGGADIQNGGLGAVAAVGRFGTVAASAAASRTANGETGLQVSASTEFDIGNVTVHGRMQRTFDDYQDIASIIDAASSASDGLFPLATRPPKAIDQVAVSLPLVFDPSSINLSFTRIESFDDEERSVIGLSYSRSIQKKATVYVSAFKEIGDNGFGVHAGLSIPLGRDYSSTASVSSSDGETSFGATLSKRGGDKIGDYSWQIRDSEGVAQRRGVRGEYRAPFAEIGAGIEQSGDRFRATVQMDGALVAAGGDVFLSTPINDAFAVVDVGAADVEVSHENRSVGRTNAKGKLLLPKLRAFEENRISIDPEGLPLDTALDRTREIVIPADRAGVVVSFNGGETGSAALVTFRDENGAYLPLGAVGKASDDSEPFLVGYDGQAFVTGLMTSNRIAVTLADGGTCIAEFSHVGAEGAQVQIPDVVCRSGG